MSAKRKCDELIPLFEKEGIVRHAKLGSAPILIFEAGKMLDFMVKEYKSKGVTMYTLNGS